jgi:hypothetical protein
MLDQWRTELEPTQTETEWGQEVGTPTRKGTARTKLQRRRELECRAAGHGFDFYFASAVPSRLRSRFAPTAHTTMHIAAWELSGTEDNPGGGRLTTTWIRNEGEANNKLRETGKALREA